jgi:gluconolactonase
MKKLLLLSTMALACVGCKPKEIVQNPTDPAVESFGTIERLHPALDKIIKPGAVIEKISEGYLWSEGPLWLPSTKTLIWSDVPANTIYQWSEKNGTSVYLKPSGYTGEGTPVGETGSNGLLLSPTGQLVLCQHGNRQMAYMDAPLDAPKPNFITITDNFHNRKYSSPNDAAYRKNGDLYFTDPPYGLQKQDQDENKELPFNGVFRVKDNRTEVLVDTLTRPNGIAFFPNQKTFLVANSDPQRAKWYAFDLDEKDRVVNARVFYDASESMKTQRGLPDGLRIDKQGNVFATGPGGVWIFNAAGEVLGKINIPAATSNCAFDDAEKTLYVTAHKSILRIKLRD